MNATILIAAAVAGIAVAAPTATDTQAGALYCRPAVAGEAPMTSLGSVALVCRPFAMIIRRTDGRAMDLGDPDVKHPFECSGFSDALTQQQQDAKLRECFVQMFHVPPSGS